MEGESPAAILDYAKEAHVSMIGMSTHGRSGLGRTIFGSVADDVLRNSQLTVLLIRPQSE
jgi:nucleotide-binding universal stress UspA family protein